MEPIQWYQDPKDWLHDLRQNAGNAIDDPKGMASWITTQHQILTLAKNPNASSLWFKVVSQPFPLWGVSLAQGRVVLTSPEIDGVKSVSKAGARVEKTEQLRQLDLAVFCQRFDPLVLIATPALVKYLGIKGTSISVQTAWWRPHWTKISPINPELTFRRAQESDRKDVLRFADGFSQDLQTDARVEAIGWLNRGRLLLFQVQDKNIGMAAFSGDYQDSELGVFSRISLIYVDGPSRHKGFGTAILDSIAAEIIADKKNLVLFSDASNSSASRFYDRAGFTSLGSITEFKVKTTG